MWQGEPMPSFPLFQEMRGYGKGFPFSAGDRDFLRANDGWFRPVSTQTGPDGNLWIMDWCDKYPCYQNARADPEGVDRERGRISLSTKKLEPAPGDMLRNPALVFERADEMAAQFRAAMAAAETAAREGDAAPAAEE